MDLLVRHNENGVATLTMNAPERLNALSDAMLAALHGAFDEIAEDRGIRAVILAGTGKAFCAGLDMASFAAMNQGDAAVPGSRDLAKRTHGIANRPQQCAWLWRELPVPVIAAVHGVAFGGGFQIALGPDIRYATADAVAAHVSAHVALPAEIARTRLALAEATLDRVADRGQHAAHDVLASLVQHHLDQRPRFGGGFRRFGRGRRGRRRCDCVASVPSRFDCSFQLGVGHRSLQFVM